MRHTIASFPSAALSWKGWATPIVLLAVAIGCPGCDGGGERPRREVRIMPLGDSITSSAGGHASYRYWLWKDLEERALPVDFVGGERGVHRGRPAYADFDADHEGHWGWTTGEVRERIDDWASRHRPDVVLLHLGTNDGDRDLAATSANLEAIVESLRAHRPGVAVLVARLIPVQGYTRVVRALNREIVRLVERLDRPDARVILVDHWTDFDSAADTWDGIHPDESGERKMADRWLEALSELQPWACCDGR